MWIILFGKNWRETFIDEMREVFRFPIDTMYTKQDNQTRC
jgi:hypothetical protein